MRKKREVNRTGVAGATGPPSRPSGRFGEVSPELAWTSSRAEADASGAVTATRNLSSHRQDNLADMAAFLHQPMRLCRVGEWELGIHHRLHRAVFEQWPHVFGELSRDRALFFGRPRPKRRSSDGQSTSHHLHQIELDARRLEKRYLHQATFDGEHVEIARDVVTSDHVKHHLGAGTVCGFADGLHP